MMIWLLTHSEEKKKDSATGPLVKNTLGNQCRVIEWARKEPDADLLSLAVEDTAIIYLATPDSPILNSENLSQLNNVIILDGTWQQARKMYNRSSYLHKFPHYEIENEQSVYTKRRNQKATGLCTAEVAIHLLKKVNNPKASELLDTFLAFNQ